MAAAFFAVVALGLLAFAKADCPDVGVQSGFNLTEYVSRRWYIQKQMVIQ